MDCVNHLWLNIEALVPTKRVDKTLSKKSVWFVAWLCASRATMASASSVSLRRGQRSLSRVVSRPMRRRPEIGDLPIARCRCWPHSFLAREVCQPGPEGNLTPRLQLPDIIQWAAEHGRINTLIFLREWVDGTLLSPNPSRRARALARGLCPEGPTNNNAALIGAAQCNHVDALQVLKDVWGLTQEDARANNNAALREACWRGHVQVVHFLADQWHLGYMDAFDGVNEHNAPLRGAAEYGHVAVLQCLRDKYEVTVHNARSCNALIHAAKYGHVNVLHFLKEWRSVTWQGKPDRLTLVDVRAWCNEALRVAAEFGQLEVLQFFKAWRDDDGTPLFAACLTKADVRADNDYALTHAKRNGHAQVVRFLEEWLEE